MEYKLACGVERVCVDGADVLLAPDSSVAVLNPTGSAFLDALLRLEGDISSFIETSCKYGVNKKQVEHDCKTFLNQLLELSLIECVCSKANNREFE